MKAMGKKFMIFVAVAVIVAIVLVTGVKSLTDILKSVWTFAVETDKGYMWIVNILVAAVVAYIFKQSKAKGATALGFIGFVLTAIFCECILWHRTEIWGIIVSNTFEPERLTNVGLGILASAIGFIIAEKVG